MQKEQKKKIKIGEFKPVDRIVVIGDLHGDILQLLSILINANLIERIKSNSCISENDYDINNWKWIGKTARLVQMGDIFDGKRGDDDVFKDNEVEIYNFLVGLKHKALKQKGNVFILVGNHELMNFNKDYRYVQDGSMTKCLYEKKGNFSFKAENKKCNDRNKLFSIPDGPLAKSMYKYVYGIIRIGDFVFCHGGVSLELAKKYTITQMNIVFKKYLKKKKYTSAFNKIYGDKGITWFRGYTNNNNCSEFHETLKKLKVKKMVVGHTPQSDGITNYCMLQKKSLLAVDVGLSRAFKNNSQSLQYAEILNNSKVNIMTSTQKKMC